jgi:hypothetical protein
MTRRQLQKFAVRGYNPAMPDKRSDGHSLDRELGELLQELRVVLPGVQVLFAFLLTVPFTSRFPSLERPSASSSS